jgi:flagellar protein FlgJ
MRRTRDWSDSLSPFFSSTEGGSVKIQNGFSLKPPTPEAKAAQQDAQLRDAAKMYESHFLNEMVKAMRSTVGQEDGFIKKNFAEKMFTDQLDQQYVQNWSDRGGVGLADMIYNQIKEKYFAAKQKDLPGQKMLPIAPKREVHGLESPDSIHMKARPPAGPGKMGFRFEVPDPSHGGFEVRAPRAGKVVTVNRLDADWSALTLDHGDGLSSELTFPGGVTELGAGAAVQAGQRLGILDASRPALAWNLDWTQG